MTSLSALTVTPRQARKFIIRCMEVGLVPFMQSSPAMGKSALVKSIAKEYNLKLIDHRLSTSAPEDLSGLPRFTEDGTATFVPFDMFPTEDKELPLWPGETERKFDAAGNCINCYQGWLVFLDEFNSASKMVQAAAYKLVLDRETGLKKLHPNVAIVAAGNLTTDRAIVNPISTAMQSRLVHLVMDLNHQEFMEDVAFPMGWDGRIIAYLNYRPDKLHDFQPDHNDKTFCSPRTWEFVNKLIKGREYQTIQRSDGMGFYEMEEEAALIGGAITSGVATDFIQFTKVYENLPKYAQIVDDPKGTKVPTDGPTRWATITHLIEKVDEDGFDSVSTYLGRFPAEFRVLFFRGLVIRKPELKKHQAFRKAAVELSKYLYDDAEAA